MSAYSEGVTTKTHDLIQAWVARKKRVQRLESELADARNAVHISENQLGEWLVPLGIDVREGEAFNIWFGSGVLQAMRTPSDNYTVSWRKEPDGKDRLEFGL